MLCQNKVYYCNRVICNGTLYVGVKQCMGLLHAYFLDSDIECALHRTVDFLDKEIFLIFNLE